MPSTHPTKRTPNVVFRDDETTIGRRSRERNSPEIWKSCSPRGGVGGGLWGLRPPATKWGTKWGSPRWFVTYHGSVSDELLLFIFFILIHGDGDWFFLERFFVFYQSIESLISQSFSVFHIGDRVIIHDFIKVSSSTFFNPGGCTPHEIHIWTWGEVGGSWKLILEWMISSMMINGNLKKNNSMKYTVFLWKWFLWKKKKLTSLHSFLLTWGEVGGKLEIETWVNDFLPRNHSISQFPKRGGGGGVKI